VSIRRHFGILSILPLLLIALGAQPALSQSGGRGAIIDDYEPETGEPAPDWARQSISRSRMHLAATRGGTEVAVSAAVRDDLDMRHVRFDQRYRGLPVFGAQTVTHVDAAGAVVGESGRFYDGISLDITPSVDPQIAIQSAQQTLGYQGQFAEPPGARLLVLPKDGQYLLTYQVTLKIEDGTEATAHHHYFVDATNGAIVLHYNSLAHQRPARPSFSEAIGIGNSLYSGEVPLYTDRSRRSYVLRDPTRGGMYTNDLREGVFGIGLPLVDRDNIWGDGTPGSAQSAAVDAHYGAAQTWDYYLNVHGRRGIDGASYQLLSRVHYGTNYNNAFWNGSSVSYGDGDGVLLAPLVALDVVGHEITHGVTEKTAGLLFKGESGAINESFSDIFGTAIEFYARNGGAKPANYWIGEDIFLPADTVPGFRNLQDPTEDGDPDHYANRLYPEPCTPEAGNDNCGVHSNSGIQNKVFYLLAEGGAHPVSGVTVPAIGRDKAERLFYRALTVYLFPSAQFSDARAACLNAANDLFGSGSPEAQATAAAWDAVGVQ
jgi:thermolysin